MRVTHPIMNGITNGKGKSTSCRTKSKQTNENSSNIMKISNNQVRGIISILVATMQLPLTFGLTYYTSGGCDDSLYDSNLADFEGTHSPEPIDSECDFDLVDSCTVDVSSWYYDSYTTTCNSLGAMIVLYDELTDCSVKNGLTETLLNKQSCMDATCTETSFPDPYTSDSETEGCTVTQSNIRVHGGTPRPTPDGTLTFDASGSCDNSLWEENADEFEGTYSTAPMDSGCFDIEICTVDVSSWYQDSFKTTCSSLGGLLIMYDNRIDCTSSSGTALTLKNLQICMTSKCSYSDFPDPYTSEPDPEGCTRTQSNIRVHGGTQTPTTWNPTTLRPSNNTDGTKMLGVSVSMILTVIGILANDGVIL